MDSFLIKPKKDDSTHKEKKPQGKCSGLGGGIKGFFSKATPASLASDSDMKLDQIAECKRDSATSSSSSQVKKVIETEEHKLAVKKPLHPMFLSGSKAIVTVVPQKVQQHREEEVMKRSTEEKDSKDEIKKRKESSRNIQNSKRELKQNDRSLSDASTTGNDNCKSHSSNNSDPSKEGAPFPPSTKVRILKSKSKSSEAYQYKVSDSDGNVIGGSVVDDEVVDVIEGNVVDGEEIEDIIDVQTEVAVESEEGGQRRSKRQATLSSTVGLKKR